MQVAKLSHQQRPELSEAHRNFLDSISREAEAVFQREKEDACQELHEEITRLRQKLDGAEVTHASTVAELAAQHSSALVELRSQHAVETRDWEAALARHDSGSKLFKYTVRGSSGPHLSGSVPCSIFEAEPGSALARMYNGEWDYPKDDEGRAVVNSDPDNWPVIINWLSFGTIPNSPTGSLLSECRYWQLSKLLAAIQAKQESIDDDDAAGMIQAMEDSHRFSITRVVASSHGGFSVRGMIQRFPTRLAAATDQAAQLCIAFTAAGRDWTLNIHQKGYFLYMLTGLALTRVLMKVQWGSGAHAISQEVKRERVIDLTMGLGWRWATGEVKRLIHPSMVSVQGSMQLTMTVAFKH